MKPESVIYILKCCAVQKLWGCWATLKIRHKFADPPWGSCCSWAGPKIGVRCSCHPPNGSSQNLKDVCNEDRERGTGGTLESGRSRGGMGLP